MSGVADLGKLRGWMAGRAEGRVVDALEPVGGVERRAGIEDRDVIGVVRADDDLGGLPGGSEPRWDGASDRAGPRPA